jgi:hypothetical protein
MPTEIDKDLATTLKQAKAGRPMQFAFLSKGTGGTLLASKKLLPAEIAEAKKKEGGTLIRGRLVAEDGQLVFEVAKEPHPALAAQLKRSIKEHAGLTWDVEVRVKGDAEEDDEAETPVSKEAVLGRLQRLTPQVKSALAGPDAGRVQTLLGAVNGLVKNNDFAQADKVLDELEPLVSAPSSSPPQAPPTAPDAKTAVMKRLGGLTGSIKAALAGPNAARVQTLFGAINGLVKNNDFVQADKVLDELEPLLGAPSPPPPPPDAKTAVMKRLGGLTGPIKAALAGPNAARVQTLFGAINGLIKNNDFVQAGKVLDELEPLVGAPTAPPPPPDAKAAVMKRLGGLTAAIKAALAGPNAARVQTLFGAINGLVKNNDFVQAGKVLDELEPLVGATAPPKDGAPGVPPPPPGKPPPSLAPEGAEFRKRLTAVQGPYMAALPLVADSGVLRQLMSAAAAAAKGGDFTQALSLIAQLEQALKNAPRKEGAPSPGGEEEEEEEETPEAKKTFFALQKSRVLWDQTHRRMKEQLEQLEQTVLETCEQINEDLEAEDEVDPEQLAAGTRKLHGILERLDERLIDKLDEALNAADAEQRRKHQDEARTIVKEYVAFVNSDPLMAVIDNNGFTDAKIADPVLTALKELSGNL